MKLKYIVAALGLLASAASQATITSPNNTATGSELFLSVWEQGAPNGSPDQSFTLDLGVTFTQFLANNSTSATMATLLSSDPIWTGFLATSDTADVGALQWAVIGADAKNPLSIMGTVQNGQESTVTQTTSPNLVVGNSQLVSFIMGVNTTGTHPTQANGESVNAKGGGQNAYFQDLELNNLNDKAWYNSNPIGATAEFTRAVRTASTVAETVQPGVMTFANNGGAYVLSYTVAAVPEASGIAMTFAGLLGIGFVGSRRRSGRND